MVYCRPLPCVVPGTIAFDIIKERSTNARCRAIKRAVARVYDNGLVLQTCSVDANTVRILVSLTASVELVPKVLDILKRSPSAVK